MSAWDEWLDPLVCVLFALVVGAWAIWGIG
jgi:hypothetical protein